MKRKDIDTVQVAGTTGEEVAMETIFARIKDGDERAFERVFRAFYRPLCDYAVTLLGSEEDAEDVVQDLFTRVWADRQEMEVQESVKSYLFTAVRFGALNVLKRRAVEQKHSASLAEFIEDLQREDYSEEETRRVERIKEVLQTLPAQCRTVFTMSCLEGHGEHGEVARGESLPGYPGGSGQGGEAGALFHRPARDEAGEVSGEQGGEAFHFKLKIRLVKILLHFS